MRRRNPGGFWLPALLVCAACGGGAATPAPAGPGPRAATDVVADSLKRVAQAQLAFQGHWSFTAQIGGESYAGTMDLTPGAAGWQAKLVEDTMGELSVTSVTVAGTTMTLSVTAGEDVATVTATQQPDGSLAGKVVVRGGEGTFTAKKG